MSINKMPAKIEKIKKHKNENIARRLRLAGIMMTMASAFMMILPFLYKGTYAFLVRHTAMPRVDSWINLSLGVGAVFALIYSLMGLYTFRAGEEGTFLSKGMNITNNIIAVLAVIAAIFMFLPIPDQTFFYAVSTYRAYGAEMLSLIFMGILTIVDMAIIVGITIAVAVIDNYCVIKRRKLVDQK